MDFGAQTAQLIARRVREAHVFSELVPATFTAQQVQAKNPAAIILTGGPARAEGAGSASPARQFDEEILNLGIPLLALGSSCNLLAEACGSASGGRPAEVGEAKLRRTNSESQLLAGTPDEQSVWMGGGASLSDPPEGFLGVAATEFSPNAAIEDPVRRLYGVQWQPEVPRSEWGQQVLENFLYRAAGLSPSWHPASIVDRLVDQIRTQVGSAQVICGLSGGVDSSVAAALVHKAVGDQLTCIFVDHGLLREGEKEQVEQDYAASMGIRVVSVDESERFLTALAGVSEPETKRKIIGREFIRSFEEAAAALTAEAAAAGGSIDFLTQGTLYPDVVESGAREGTANIKSHHNVGGLPEDLEFELVEPLRDLFKDEVRAIGRELGVPDKIVDRQPFPGPGLGIRVIGEVTPERLKVLRGADQIVREEMTAAGLDNQIWQCPVVLLADVRSVGVSGDERTYGHPIVLRPVVSEDAMTAEWAPLSADLLARISTRITNEVPEVNRVALDITSKPPGTIEWE